MNLIARISFLALGFLAVPDGFANDPDRYKTFMRDFGPAFELLRDYGLREIPEDAVYGSIGGNPRQFPGIWSLQLQGWGWKDGDQLILMTGGTGSMTGQHSHWSAPPQELPPWEAVDLDDDIATILTLVRPPKPGEEEDVEVRVDGFSSTNLELSSSLSFSEPGGGNPLADVNVSGLASLVLCAATLHFQGYEKEAAEITARVLAAAESPRKPIEMAIDTLASQEFDRVCAKRISAREWDPFAQDLADLQSRFGSAWSASPLASRLIEKLKAQKDLAELPETPVSLTLTEADRDLAQQLLEAEPAQLQTNMIYYATNGLSWILGTAPGEEDADSANMTDQYGRPIDLENNLIVKLVDRGVDSLPLLLTLLKDERFTALDSTAQSGRGYDLSYFGNMRGQSMNSQYLDQMYQQLRKPTSMAEISHSVLSTILPLGDERPESREEMMEIGKDWYLRVRDAKPRELARNFFEEGGENQKQLALNYLLHEASDVEIAEIEEYLYNDVDLMYGFQTVQLYFQKRGEAADEFYKKIRKELRERIDSTSEDTGEKQYLERNLATLEAMMSGQTLEELLKEVVKGGQEKLGQMYEALQQKIESEEPEVALRQLLVAANDADDEPLMRSYFVRLLGSTGVEDVEFEADLWEPLLNDDRNPQGYYSIGDSTAFMISNLADPEFGGTLNQSWQEFGGMLSGYVRDRARAFIAGEEPPGLPSPDDVSEERADEIFAVLTGEVAEARKAWDGLNHSERFLIARTVGDAEEGEASKLAEKLLALQFTLEAADGAGWSSVAELTGKPFDVEGYKALIEEARTRAKAGESWDLTIERKAGVDGLTLTLESAEAKPASLTELTPDGELFYHFGYEPSRGKTGDDFGYNDDGAAVKGEDLPKASLVGVSLTEAYAYWIEPLGDTPLEVDESIYSLEEAKDYQDELEAYLPDWITPSVGLSSPMTLTIRITNTEHLAAAAKKKAGSSFDF
ncbi:MAG: hypothetical protein AAF585_02880 [Verrucomicrobiota bacterium]